MNTISIFFLILNLQFGLYQLVNSIPHNAEPKIVGGHYAEIGEFLFPVSIQIKTRHICGGTLIGNDTVVTAAHCVIEENYEHYQVVVGIQSLRNYTDKNVFTVTKFVKHKNYNEDLVQNDIALLKIKNNFGFNILDYAQPISVNTKPVKDHAICTVLGWGDVYSGANSGSIVLKYVNIPIVPKTECAKVYGQILTKCMLCAGNPGQDSCQGDSGGPLICDNSLVGIVSFGLGCGSVPGVYTDVSYYSTWIKANWNSASCSQFSVVLITAVSIISILKDL